MPSCNCFPEQQHGSQDVLGVAEQERQAPCHSYDSADSLHRVAEALRLEVPCGLPVASEAAVDSAPALKPAALWPACSRAALDSRESATSRGHPGLDQRTDFGLVVRLVLPERSFVGGTSSPAGHVGPALDIQNRHCSFAAETTEVPCLAYSCPALPERVLAAVSCAKELHAAQLLHSALALWEHRTIVCWMSL